MQTLDTASQIVWVILLGTLLFMLLGVIIFLFILIFKQRQRRNLEEKAQLTARYIQESLKSQIEVQNATLADVGRNLHDNIGQLLGVMRISLNMVEDDENTSPESKASIANVSEIIELAIDEVRTLTKSLDSSFVEDFGLLESVQLEVERLRKSRKYVIHFEVHGDAVKFQFDREIVIFRAFQEILNNTIKHSGAKNISFEFRYDNDGLLFTATDDGKGFNYDEVMQRGLTHSGAGLRNIVERIKLIGGSCEFKTFPGQGTSVVLRILKT
ncbi:Histidine kinase [Dyadobacter sp. SG02]|uniref:sensor histidine kinase n=1 Tax=Dyadobacter sp. SG02 TaxID=1855291 RepID=UPI0008B02B32|nr:ATP-binding protein [Dyadobacter sp. SG02]SEI40415.1 Histidine kinase [Dyadobacter sp. SG02]